MLRKIKRLLRASTERPQAEPAITPAGYQLPKNAAALVNTALRKNCLQKLWETSLLPRAVYQRFYQAPVYSCWNGYRAYRPPPAENGLMTEGLLI